MSITLTRRALLATGAASLALSTQAEEPILDPGLPIVDAHHHMSDLAAGRYMLPELMADIDTGHNVVATVFADSMAMYRADGPEMMRPVGEVEFANGIAAMAASGRYGKTRVAAAIVSGADLRHGGKIKALLEAQIEAAPHHFRGIRDSIAWDPHPLVMFGAPLDTTRKGVMADPDFRDGVRCLGELNLTFDGWCLHPQIAEFAALADAAPNTTLVLNHLGTPLGIGPYAGKRRAVFDAWKPAMIALAKRPNVVVKLGGLGMEPTGSPYFRSPIPATAAQLAAEWRPYIETAIETFGPDRCLFESNFPMDKPTCSYHTLWNVFKTISTGASYAEKTALFSGTATRTYRLT